MLGRRDGGRGLYSAQLHPFSLKKWESGADGRLRYVSFDFCKDTLNTFVQHLGFQVNPTIPVEISFLRLVNKPSFRLFVSVISNLLRSRSLACHSAVGQRSFARRSTRIRAQKRRLCLAVIAKKCEGMKVLVRPCQVYKADNSLECSFICSYDSERKPLTAA